MKKAKICLALLIICGILFTLVYCIRTEITAAPVSYGEVYSPEGTWTVDDQSARLTAVFSFSLPQQEDREEQVLLLQSHWTDYDVYVDDSAVFSASGGKAGSYQLISLPEGRTLTIRFYYEKASTVASIMRSKLFLGSKSGMNRWILRDTLCAVMFAVLAAAMGVACVCLGLFSRRGLFRAIGASLAYLGAYVLCAGVWILMDSKIMILVTQRTGLVEMLSFIAFFLMPIPLMGFTKNMLPDWERTFSVFQFVFAVTLLLYVVNEIGNFSSYIFILLAEHILISVVILVTLYTGIQQMRRRWDAKLHRIVWGYGILCVCSGLALVFFYKQRNLAYSISYMVGIMGFVVLLADSVWVALRGQIQESANMAIYAKMAYIDALTGLGNRAAFLEAEKENRTYPNSLAYIMVDANNLKHVNDTLGHHKGDELLIRIAQCITRAINGFGKCYRIGGDEYVVCLKNITSAAMADCARAIQAEIQAADSQSDFPISVAVGCAWAQTAAGEDLEQLLRQADDAMYEMKKEMKAATPFCSRTADGGSRV